VKKKELLRILAHLLALGILQPIAFLAELSQASAEGQVFDERESTQPTKLDKASKNSSLELVTAPIDVANIRTEAELFAAIADEQKLTIILQNDIVILKDLEINRDLTLDLNGFNLTSLVENIRLIDIKYGHVRLTGKGSIVAFGNGGTAIRIRGATTADNANYSTLTVDQDVTLFAPNQCGILVAANFNAAYGATVELSGAIVAHDGITVSSNINSSGEHAPKIRLSNRAKITADENEGTAIQALGYAMWEIGACEITAATGLCFAAGEIHIDNPHILATGYVFTQVTSERQTPQKLEIESGLFAGRMGVFYGVAPHLAEGAVTNIRGGAFNADVSDYLEPGRHLEKNYKTGAFVVIEEAAPIEIMDEATQLAETEGRLRGLVEFAQDFIAQDYAAGDLGDWQPRAAKAKTALKRAITIGKKALKNDISFEKATSAINGLHKAIDNLQAIGTEIRSELASLVATVNAIEPSDYTNYSYRQVQEAMENGLELMNSEEAHYEEIYSALLDLQINLDLLEVREETDELPELKLPEMNVMADKAGTELPPMPTVALAPPAEVEASMAKEPDYRWNDLAELANFADEDELSSWEALGVSEMLRAMEEWHDEPEETTIDSLDLPEILTEEDFGPTSILELDTQVEPIMPEPELEAAFEPEEVTKARENLRTLLNAVSILNPEDYTPSSYTMFAETVKWAGDLVLNARSESELNLAFDQVNSAYSHLDKAAENFVESVVEDTKANLQTMMEAVETLTVGDYDENSAEQFGELQVALAKAKATLDGPETNLDHIVTLMDEITAATTGLKAIEAANSEEQEVNIAEIEGAPTTLMIAAQVDWSELQDVIMEIRQLDPSNYTMASYANLLGQLERAKAALNDSSITQVGADDIVFDLNLALLGLETVDNSALQALNNQIIANQSTVYTPVSQSAASLPAINETEVTANEIVDQTVTPSLLMSMMAGVYAGLATYRKSRLNAKKHKRSLA